MKSEVLDVFKNAYQSQSQLLNSALKPALNSVLNSVLKMRSFSGEIALSRKHHTFSKHHMFSYVLRSLVAATVVVILCISLTPVRANAQSFEHGVEAYLAGQYDKALGIWKPLAAEGDPVAMFNIGVLHAQGLGVTQNPAEAVTWYRQSADLGYAPAQFNLGASYHNGQGVDRNDELAANWWQLAADQGEVQAQYHLAVLYLEGRGVAYDPTAARYFLEQAARRGDTRATDMLAEIEETTPGDAINSAQTPKVVEGENPGSSKVPTQAQGDQSLVNMSDVDMSDKVSRTVAAASEKNLNKDIDKDLNKNLSEQNDSKAHTTDVVKAEVVDASILNTALATAAQAQTKTSSQTTIPQTMTEVVADNGEVSIEQARAESSVQLAKSARPTRDDQLAERLPVKMPEVLTAQDPAPRIVTAENGAKVTYTTESNQDANGLWVNRYDPGSYTIQLVATKKEAAARDFIKKHNLGDLAQVFFAGGSDKSLYKVVYGNYVSTTEAKAARKSLPAAVIKNKPWIRDLASIQAEATEPSEASSDRDDVNKKVPVEKQTVKTQVGDASPSTPPVPADKSAETISEDVPSEAEIVATKPEEIVVKADDLSTELSSTDTGTELETVASENTASSISESKTETKTETETVSEIESGKEKDVDNADSQIIALSTEPNDSNVQTTQTSIPVDNNTAENSAVVIAGDSTISSGSLDEQVLEPEQSAPALNADGSTSDSLDTIKTDTELTDTEIARVDDSSGTQVIGDEASVERMEQVDANAPIPQTPSAMSDSEPVTANVETLDDATTSAIIAVDTNQENTPSNDSGNNDGVKTEDNDPESVNSDAAIQNFTRGQRAFNRQDYESALKHWQPLAESGHSEAQYGLGFMYETGWGVQRQPEEALNWYRRSAEQGYAKAQYNLGMMYLVGNGVPADESMGLFWIQSAADQNDLRARARLSRMRAKSTSE